MTLGGSKAQTISDVLTDEIRRGVYDEDGKIPGETALAIRFRVARETLRKALAKLEKAGLVERQKGSGTYVSPRDQRKSGLLGLLIPDASSVRIFRDFVREIVRLARRNGYEVVVREISSASDGVDIKQRIRRAARELIVMNVEGVIFRPLIDERLFLSNREVVRIFRNSRVPTVLMDADVETPPERSDCDLVTIDNVSAGRRVAEHLIAQNRRKVAFFMSGTSVPSNANWRNRLFGVAGELALRNVEEAVRTLNFKPDSLNGFRRLYRSNFRPDAIVCGNDETAVQVVSSLLAVGKRVPEDVAVVGFDDSDIASSCAVALTTVRQPSKEIAKSVLRTLLARIQHPDDAPREIHVPAPLIIRQST